MRKRVELFGLQIDPLTMGETIKRIEELIRQSNPAQHVVVNVAKLVMANEDAELRNIINSCDIVNADGQGIVFGAKLLGINIPERVAGIDLFENLVEVASKKGYRLYFFGAKEDIVREVVFVFRNKFKGLQIAGFRNGYYAEGEEDDVVRKISGARPDILFVAMGSPKKEMFLKKHLNKLNVPFVMGVGGSFDIVAGLTRRSPLWMQKIGLEWFFRFLCEPKRMWKRYLRTNLVYMGMLVRALFFRRKEGLN